MIVVIAVIAALFAGPATLLRRSGDFERRGRVHAKELGRVQFSDLEFYLFLSPVQRDTEHPRTPGERQADEDAERRMNAEIMPLVSVFRHHTEMAEKYRDAAAHPWLSVAPDPPAPPLPTPEEQRALRARYPAFFGRPW